VANSCEHGNEYLGSIKGGEFLDQVRDNQLLKKDSAPQICLAVNETEAKPERYGLGSNLRQLQHWFTGSCKPQTQLRLKEKHRN
jgi:hypothetical protein